MRHTAGQLVSQLVLGASSARDASWHGSVAFAGGITWASKQHTGQQGMFLSKLVSQLAGNIFSY
jgi:hypothetical protein